MHGKVTKVVVDPKVRIERYSGPSFGVFGQQAGLNAERKPGGVVLVTSAVQCGTPRAKIVAPEGVTIVRQRGRRS